MLSVCVPAYNEADRICATLSAIRSIDFSPDEYEVIVADDGSHDGTARRADECGADVVLRLDHAGKGAALQAAFDVSRGDPVLLLDGDLEASAAQAIALLDAIRSCSADMAIATFPRVAGSGGGLGIVVRLARWGVKRLTGLDLTSPLSGQRALKRAVVEQSGGFAPGWGVELALTISAARAGWRIAEVPTSMSHRVTGRKLSDWAHRGAQLVAAVSVLAALWRARRPPRRTADRQ